MAPKNVPLAEPANPPHRHPQHIPSHMNPWHCPGDKSHTCSGAEPSSNIAPSLIGDTFQISAPTHVRLRHTTKSSIRGTEWPALYALHALQQEPPPGHAINGLTCTAEEPTRAPSRALLRAPCCAPRHVPSRTPGCAPCCALRRALADALHRRLGEAPCGGETLSIWKC